MHILYIILEHDHNLFLLYQRLLIRYRKSHQKKTQSSQNRIIKIYYLISFMNSFKARKKCYIWHIDNSKRTIHSKVITKLKTKLR